MLALRTILYAAKRVLFVVPYVSIVVEKVDYFGRLYGEEGIPVQGYCSGAPPTSAAASSSNAAAFGNGGSGLPELSVCTIEKAAVLVNALLADGSEDELGCVVVDEAHMIGDRDRGYVLEIMLAKLRYVCAHTVQIVCLSATVPNIADLAAWLDADLYMTDFRPIPLCEYVVCGGKVRDSKGTEVRTLAREEKDRLTDPDGIAAICSEAVGVGKSVLVFCATKKSSQHCAQLIASVLAAAHAREKELAKEKRRHGTIQNDSDTAKSASGSDGGVGVAGGGGGGGWEAGGVTVVVEGSVEWERNEIVKQLQGSPCGMDAALGALLAAGVAFHHAGLTMEERSIIEGAFHRGTISVLTATSTLAAGVNLPADRVIVRSPKVGAADLDVERYRQMVGRAGRAGKGLTGESYFIATQQEYPSSLALLHAPIPPLLSCLTNGRPEEGGMGGGQVAIGLRRAVLDALDIGLAVSFEDLVSFVRCTFLAQSLSQQIHLSAPLPSPALPDAPPPTHASAPCDVMVPLEDYVKAAVQWLESCDMVWKIPATSTSVTTCAAAPTSALARAPGEGVRGSGGHDREGKGCMYASTHLGQAVVASSISPAEALVVFDDLVTARQGGVVMDDDLHVIYLVTPLTPFAIPWARFYDIYQVLPAPLVRIADKIGVDPRFLLRARTRAPPTSWEHAPRKQVSKNGPRKPDEEGGTQKERELEKEKEREKEKKDAARRACQIHARFFSALMLRELLLEVHLVEVSDKYHVPRGAVQQIRTSAVSFTGMIASFCGKLRWWQLQTLGVQFHERLMSQGVCNAQVLPLMMVPSIKSWWATYLYDSGIKTLEQLARADPLLVQQAIRASMAFAAGPTKTIVSSSSSSHAAASAFASKIAQHVIAEKASALLQRQAHKVVTQAQQILHRRAGRLTTHNSFSNSSAIAAKSATLRSAKIAGEKGVGGIGEEGGRGGEDVDGAGGREGSEGGVGVVSENQEGVKMVDLANASEVKKQAFIRLCRSSNAGCGGIVGGAVCVVCDLAEERLVKVTPAGRVVGKTNIAAQNRIKLGVTLAPGVGVGDEAKGGGGKGGEGGKGAGGRSKKKILVGLALSFRVGPILGGGGGGGGEGGAEGNDEWGREVFYFRIDKGMVGSGKEGGRGRANVEATGSTRSVSCSDTAAFTYFGSSGRVANAVEHILLDGDVTKVLYRAKNTLAVLRAAGLEVSLEHPRMCIHKHTSIHAHIHTYPHTCTHVCMHKNTCVHAHIHTYSHKCTRMHVLTKRVYTCTYTHIPPHVHITCPYICVFIPPTPPLLILIRKQVHGPLEDPLVAHWLLKCAKGDRATNRGETASSGGDASQFELRAGR